MAFANIKFTSLLLLLNLIFPFLILAAEYHVGGTGASDSNPGTVGSPWATLQKAADTVIAGDTVFVHAGTYKGFEIANKSGTSSSRIVFKADSGVTINENASGIHNKDGINLEMASYITIDGFILVGSRNSSTSRAGIRVVGNGDDAAGVFSTGVIIKNNKCSQWGIWGIFCGFAENITIENNECSESAKEHGIYFSNSADNPIIRGNRVWGNANAGIHVNSDIDSGNLANPKVDGIIRNALIENNIIYENGDGYVGVFDSSTGGGSAINMDGVQDSLVQNNLLYNNHASGISLYRVDGAEGAKNNTIVNNTIIMAQYKNGTSATRYCLNIVGAGTPYTPSSGNTIFNNIFYNLGTRGSITVDDGSRANMKSDYNICEDYFLTVNDADSGGDLVRDITSWRTLGFDANSIVVSLAQMKALFTDYDNKDYSLVLGSSAISFGATTFNSKSAPTTDINANTRSVAYDVGAYEYQATVTYSITASAGSNGSISPSGSISVNQGGSQAFTFTPATGFQVADVLVNGVSVGNASTYTISNITENKTISVSFSATSTTTYLITILVGANGVSSPASNTTVNNGANQTINFTPDSNYEVNDVTLDGVSQGAITTLTLSNITANHTVAVSFKLKTYAIISSANSGGVITPSGTSTINHGSNQSYTITPNTGYTVSDVQVDGVSQGSISSYTFSNVTTTHTIQAIFSISGGTHTISANSDANGTITPSGAIAVAVGGTQEFTFTPNSGYEVDRVVIDGTSVGALTTYTFTNVVVSHTISVIYKVAATTHTIAASAGANGSISPNGNVTVAQSASQTFTFSAANGFEIEDVVVNGVSQGVVASYTFSNVTSDATIAVTFKNSNNTTDDSGGGVIDDGTDNGSGSTNSGKGGGGGGCQYTTTNNDFGIFFLFLVLVLLRMRKIVKLTTEKTQ